MDGWLYIGLVPHKPATRPGTKDALHHADESAENVVRSLSAAESGGDPPAPKEVIAK